MPNLDTLSIQFNANGTTKAVKNIKDMGLAIRSLATNINSIDASKLDAVASSMNQLKKSAPTKDQTQRVTNFGTAVKGIADTFQNVNTEKINGFATSMNAIKKAAPTKQQAERVGGFSSVLGTLSGAINGIDGSKLDTFASGMDVIKKSIPTKNQTQRLSTFATAVTELSNAIGAANIGEFSKDMEVLGGAVENFKKSSVNSISNAVAAMQNMKQTATQTAGAIQQATPKNQQTNLKMGDNRAVLSDTKELIASLDKVEVKATGVTRILSKMGLATPTKQFKSLEKDAEAVRQKYEEVRATLQKGLDTGAIMHDSSDYKKKMAELDALRNKYDELILKQREMAQEGSAFKISPTLTKTVDAFKSGFASAGSVIKNGFVGALRFANKHISSFASRLRNVGSSLKQTITGGNNATKMAKKFANELLRVSKMLKLMVTRMALRKVIAEVGNGFKSLALHSDEFNNSVSGLMNGAKQLGYSFSALVSPLINALAPAIVYVIDLLIKLLNAINQVMSALLGFSSWNKAKKFTDSWRDSIEDAGSSAKKTAKELKKTVLGFDELNQLQDNKNTSSGGGSNAIKDMFETLPIDKKWKDIADWLKQMWKIGDFTELGKKIGEKLRDMLESIPWELIRKTANKIGRSLATLINGFVEVERLGYDIGKTIAQSVNTVFEFINGFVHKLHWDSVGKFIADTFNGFFENIDWDLIKDTVVTGMAGLAKAIQTFIDEFHWDNISDFIINGMDTITSGIKAFIEGIDWLDLGKKIGDQINKTLSGIDWKSVGETIGEVIEAAVDWAYGLITTFSVDDAVKALTDLLNGIAEKVDAERIGETLGTLLHKLIKIIQDFWANEDNRNTVKEGIINFFKGVWGSLDANDIGFLVEVALGAALLLGLKNALKVLLPAALSAGGSIGAKIIFGIVEFFAVAELGKLWGKYLFPDDKELYEGYAGITGTLKLLKDFITSLGEWLYDYLTVGWSMVIAKLEIYTTKFVESFKALFTVLKTILTGDWDDLSSVTENINTIYDALRDGNESLKESEENFDRLKRQFGAIVDPDSVTRVEDFSQALNGVKSTFAETKDDADAFATALDKIKTNINDSTGSYDAASASLKTMGDNAKSAYDAASASANKLYDASRGTATEISNAAKKMGEMKGDSEKMSSAVNESSSVMERLRDKLKETKDSSKNYTDMKTTVEKDSGAVKSAVNGIDFNPATQEVNRFSSDAIADYLNFKTEVTDSTKDVMDEVNAIDLSDATKAFSDFDTDTSKSMDDAKKAVSDGAKDINTDIKSIQSSFTKDKWTFNGVADGLAETFRKAKQSIAREWNKIANTLNGDHKVGSGDMRINLPKFRSYASGGIVEDGIFFANHHELVGHFNNGKTAVANNDQIIKGIEGGVYNGVSAALARQGGSDKYISNTIVVDGETLARTVTKAQQKQNMRYSPNMA